MHLINHIAILVPTVERAAACFSRHGCKVGSREEFDGEGTAEIYVGDDMSSARVLLLEAIKPGAYQRALQRRGPGLHHIAIDVTDVHACVDGFSGAGWYLHPKSLATIKKSKTAWLARPGTKVLIEVQERKEVFDDPPFVQRLEMPLTGKETAMMAALNKDQIHPSRDGKTRIVVGDLSIELDELIAR